MREYRPDWQNEDWSVATPEPRIHVVHFANPIMMRPEPGGPVEERWRLLAESVEDGGVLVLNFAGIEYLSGGFLALLIQSYKELRPRGARIVACHLAEEVREIFDVVGQRQPLDFMLHYVESEDQAIARAREFVCGDSRAATDSLPPAEKATQSVRKCT